MKDAFRLVGICVIIVIILGAVFIEEKIEAMNNYNTQIDDFQKNSDLCYTDEIVNCNTTYVLSNVEKEPSIISDNFILRGIEARESYVDLVFTFRKDFIIKNFKTDLEFLDINKKVLSHKEIIIDGVYSKYFTNFTCNIPKGATNIKINTISFSSYKKDDVLFADLDVLHQLGELSEIGLADLQIKRKNNVTLELNYKKKYDYKKAILMIHTNDGTILNSYVLDENKYNCEINTDFGPMKYSVCFFK